MSFRFLGNMFGGFFVDRDFSFSTCSLCITYCCSSSVCAFLLSSVFHILGFSSIRTLLLFENFWDLSFSFSEYVGCVPGDRDISFCTCFLSVLYCSCYVCAFPLTSRICDLKSWVSGLSTEFLTANLIDVLHFRVFFGSDFVAVRGFLGVNEIEF